MELEYLKQILIASIEKNGDKPLTLKHLVNIINMVQKKKDREDRLSNYDFDPDWN